MPVRAPDGRFAPQTGNIELPPRQTNKSRDEHGRWIKSERVVSSKPYSKAVRELLEAPKGSIPQGWDLQALTGAQELAMVHMAQAQGGNVQIGMVIIDRAEGKVPQAAEDREAAVKAGTGVKLLMDLLGIKVQDVEVEVIKDDEAIEPPALPAAPSES